MQILITYDNMMPLMPGPESPYGDKNRFVNQNALVGHVKERQCQITRSVNSPNPFHPPQLRQPFHRPQRVHSRRVC